MASYQAFNSMMEEFLKELIQTIPEEKSLKLELTKFQTLKKTNSKSIVQAFMNTVGPHSDSISSRNEKHLLSNDIEFLKKINICKWWTDELSVNTKNAIWQYLNTLLMLGSTITSIPSDMLQSIENVAETCAEQMDNSTGGMPDLGSLFAGIQQLIGSNPNFNKN